MIALLTAEQEAIIAAAVLDMQRHNLWCSLVRSDPQWPYPCLCTNCNQESL